MPDADRPDSASLPPAGMAIDARLQDAYWCGAFAAESYVLPGLDYEDYAPAYCVGYVGYAQYGSPWEDAERSLWANWERIKGGSRLSWDDARPAIRAAWDRVQEQARRQPALARPVEWREPWPQPAPVVPRPGEAASHAQA